MLQDLPMVVMAAVLVFALGGIAFYTIRRWHNSRAPGNQEPPENATKKWLDREARNMRGR